MHDKMVDNPFDMSNKYNPRPLSGQQRDMNPLGHPLRANSHFLQVFVPATSTVTQTHTVVIYCVIVTRDQRDQRSPEKRALMTS